MFLRTVSQAAPRSAAALRSGPMACLHASKTVVAAQQARAASDHAIANPTLAGIEKRWEGMPPQEQAELWMQLRDRMKVDWNQMTVQEKKAGTFTLLSFFLFLQGARRLRPLSFPQLSGVALRERFCPKHLLIRPFHSLLDRIRSSRSPRRDPQGRGLEDPFQGDPAHRRVRGHLLRHPLDGQAATQDHEQGVAGGLQRVRLGMHYPPFEGLPRCLSPI